jgi:hypothetical protein
MEVISMLRLGPYRLFRVDEIAFMEHFTRFWATMPPDMKDAARLSAIHLKYRPGMKPKGIWAGPKYEPMGPPEPPPMRQIKEGAGPV